MEEEEREVLDLTPETPPEEQHPAVIPEETPPEETPPGEETPPEETPPATGDLDCSNFTFNGVAATVEVPEDLRAELTAKGIDVNAVVTELYTSEGFVLTEATKATLDTAFGKNTVDLFLSALKSQNENTFKNHADSIAAVSQAEEAAWNETAEQIGGAENWPALEAFALATMTDTALEEFNKVMASGNRYAQKLAIGDVYSKFKTAEGDPAAVLVQADGVPDGSEGAPLSYSAYQTLIRSGEYRKNPKLYDSLRRAGQAAGI